VDAYCPLVDLVGRARGKHRTRGHRVLEEEPRQGSISAAWKLPPIRLSVKFKPEQLLAVRRIGRMVFDRSVSSDPPSFPELNAEMKIEKNGDPSMELADGLEPQLSPSVIMTN